jgi:hypothetical protein
MAKGTNYFSRIIAGLVLLVEAACPAAAAPPDKPVDRMAVYAEIDSCQQSYPWICIELWVSENNGGDGDVLLMTFIHDINFAVIYRQTNLYGIPRSMLSISKDKKIVDLIVPAGTVVRTFEDEEFVFPSPIAIRWVAGKDRTEIDTTVKNFTSSAVDHGFNVTKTHQSSIVRPATATGELLGFAVDSRHGPQYVGEHAARISTTITR